MKANEARIVYLCRDGESNSTRSPARLRSTLGPERGTRPLRLTAREHEVLTLLCEGMSNKHICRRLNIATGTVKCHIANILSTLGVSSRLQAVVTAHRLGLLSENDGADQPEGTGSSLEEVMGHGRPGPPARPRLPIPAAA